MRKDLFVYVGTYTEAIRFGTGAILQGKGEGIYLYRMNTDSGALELVRTTVGVVNPSYLAIHPGKRSLFCVNELKIFEGGQTGTVSAFALDPRNGRLDFLGKKPTGGTDPCHVCTNAEGTHAFVSNFMSGSVAAFPILGDGRLGDASHFIQHEGSGVNPRRQAGPHAHSLVFDPAGRFAFVPDLGLDKLMIYEFDRGTGRLEPGPEPFLSVKPGAGPRHCAFHPSGRFMFLINELDSTMSSYSYDAARGRFSLIETVSTVPEGPSGENTCADVHIAPSGLFVYGSNRGHDSIVIYRIDPETGRLAYVGIESSGGRTPRNFAIDPSGEYLLACNQDSDTIVSFRLDPKTGGMTRTAVTEVPTPVCAMPVFLA